MIGEHAFQLYNGDDTCQEVGLIISTERRSVMHLSLSLEGYNRPQHLSLPQKIIMI